MKEQKDQNHPQENQLHSQTLGRANGGRQVPRTKAPGRIRCRKERARAKAKAEGVPFAAKCRTGRMSAPKTRVRARVGSRARGPTKEKVSARTRGSARATTTASARRDGAKERTDSSPTTAAKANGQVAAGAHRFLPWSWRRARRSRRSRSCSTWSWKTPSR